MVDNASIGLYENSRFVHHEELPTIIGHTVIGTWVVMTVTFMGTPNRRRTGLLKGESEAQKLYKEKRN